MLLAAMVIAEYAYRVVFPKTVVSATGPIYVTEIVPLLALASASGMAEIKRRTRRAWPSPRALPHRVVGVGTDCRCSAGVLAGASGQPQPRRPCVAISLRGLGGRARAQGLGLRRQHGQRRRRANLGLLSAQPEPIPERRHPCSFAFLAAKRIRPRPCDNSIGGTSQIGRPSLCASTPRKNRSRRCGPDRGGYQATTPQRTLRARRRPSAPDASKTREAWRAVRWTGRRSGCRSAGNRRGADR